MIILSLHGGHNASVAIVCDEGGQLRCWCVESERIDRIKMSCGCKRYNEEDFSPAAKSRWIRTEKSDLSMLTDHILSEADVRIEAIDLVVLSQNTALERLPAALSKIPKTFVSHHKAHAALSFYTSDFEEALVVVCDGSGEKCEDGFETQTAWSCSGRHMRQLLGTYKRSTYNMGIGNAYELYTYWLGYGYNGCGTTMALASFGRENPMPSEQIFRFSPNGDVFLNLDFINVASHVAKTGYKKQGTMAYNQDHERMIRSIALPEGYRLRNYGEPSVQGDFVRMAADIQHATEQAVLFYVEHALNHAPEHRHLCMGGGIFLNCNLNSKLRELPWVEDIHVPTAPGDGGLALGAALAAYFEDHERCKVCQTAYIGTEVHEVALNKGDIVYAERPDNIYRVTAQLLADGKLVGWCQGRAEFGPRALGHRSLLADPRNKETPNRINQMLKHREPFRPFAPAVLEEKYKEYFDGPLPIPFMLETRQILDEKVSIIPAVCHVDHSARVQVVVKEHCPEFHALLEEFYALTGVPVLVNTSLNRNGEPIVDSGEDALVLLRKGMIDALVIADQIYFLKKEG